MQNEEREFGLALNSFACSAFYILRSEIRKCQGDHGRSRANYRCCLPALAGFVSPQSMGPGTTNVAQASHRFKKDFNEAIGFGDYCPLTLQGSNPDWFQMGRVLLPYRLLIRTTNAVDLLEII